MSAYASAFYPFLPPMPTTATNNVQRKDERSTIQNSSNATNAEVDDSSKKGKTVEVTGLNIFVKSATIDLGYLITATATTAGIKRGPSFHRCGKQRRNHHARAPVNTADPDDAVQFQLLITCNKGKNRSVSRPFSRFVQLRNDLIREQQRHRLQNTESNYCYGSAPIILPELPVSIMEKLTDGIASPPETAVVVHATPQGHSSAAHGFTMIQNLLQGYYRPAMAQWLDAVTQTCPPDSSPTFQEFLCDEPCNKNESIHTDTTDESFSHDFRNRLASKSTSLHSISEDMVEDMHSDDEEPHLFISPQQPSSDVYCS